MYKATLQKLESMQKSLNTSLTSSKLKLTAKNKTLINQSNANNMQGSSLDSIKSQTSAYFDLEKKNKLHREGTFEHQQKNIDKYNRAAKRQTDTLLKDQNKIADKTLNKKANYHGLQRELPENVLLDHWRYMNDRILRAEEAKIKMECTPELVGRMYRRFLPQTVGRRNQIIDCDIQDAYYLDQYSTFFNEARDVLLTCNGNVLQGADEQLSKLKDSLASMKE